MSRTKKKISSEEAQLQGEIKNARNRMLTARTGLLIKMPFYGKMAMRCRLICDPNIAKFTGMNTACTDGFDIFYSPKFINGLNQGQCESLLAHEVVHIIHKHPIRGIGKVRKPWLIAIDIYVALLLEHEQFVPVCAGGIPAMPEYRGKTVEEIYRELLENMEKVEGNESFDGMKPFPDEREGEKVDKEFYESELERDVVNSFEYAKTCGSTPGGIEELIREFNPPMVDFSEIFLRFLQSLAKNDYTWTTPNRRFIGNDLYLPSLHSPSIDCIVFANDLSGSMGNEEVKQSLSEVKGALEQFNYNKVYSIYFDTEVQNVDMFEEGDFDFEFHPKGRGGTDPSCIFKYIKENGIEPQMLVIISDMEFNWNFEEPPYPVLWISTTEIEGKFGHTIKIKVKSNGK